MLHLETGLDSLSHILGVCPADVFIEGFPEMRVSCKSSIIQHEDAERPRHKAETGAAAVFRLHTYRDFVSSVLPAAVSQIVLHCNMPPLN